MSLHVVCPPVTLPLTPNATRTRQVDYPTVPPTCSSQGCPGQGSAPNIEPETDLVFEITLVSIGEMAEALSKAAEREAEDLERLRLLRAEREEAQAKAQAEAQAKADKKAEQDKKAAEDAAAAAAGGECGVVRWERAPCRCNALRAPQQHCASVNTNADRGPYETHGPLWDPHHTTMTAPLDGRWRPERQGRQEDEPQDPQG